MREGGEGGRTRGTAVGGGGEGGRVPYEKGAQTVLPSHVLMHQMT
jgi:hypothetical protein